MEVWKAYGVSKYWTWKMKYRNLKEGTSPPETHLFEKTNHQYDFGRELYAPGNDHMITYPSLGKGKSSSKVPAGRKYVSSLEGIYDATFQGYWNDNHVFQVTINPKFRQDVPKTQSPPIFFVVCNLVVACVTHPGNIRHELAVFSTSKLMFDWLLLKHNNWFKATSSLWSSF